MPIKSITVPILPQNTRYRGHKIFLNKYAELVGIDVKYVETNQVFDCNGHVHILVDDKPLLVSWWDLPRGIAKCEHVNTQPELQYMYSEIVTPVCAAQKGREGYVYPCGTVLTFSDKNLRRFLKMVREESIYTCNSNIILHKQNNDPNGRREKARSILISTFGNQVDYSVRHGDKFWFYEHFKNCLVSVCIPGKVDSLDRGHWEQMGLGVCTVAPPINTRVCWNKGLLNEVHYIQCKPDFSDLIDKIYWCMENRDECRQIGQNARQFFKDAYLPENYWKWVEYVLSRHY